MKLRIILLTLFISALLITLVLALRGLGIQPLSGILICAYVAGAVASFIFAEHLSHKEKVETAWMLWFFVSNELGGLLFVALWPVLAPLAIAEVLLRGKSNKRSVKK